MQTQIEMDVEHMLLEVTIMTFENVSLMHTSWIPPVFAKVTHD